MIFVANFGGRPLFRKPDLDDLYRPNPFLLFLMCLGEVRRFPCIDFTNPLEPELRSSTVQWNESNVSI